MTFIFYGKINTINGSLTILTRNKRKVLVDKIVNEEVHSRGHLPSSGFDELVEVELLFLVLVHGKRLHNVHYILVGRELRHARN